MLDDNIAHDLIDKNAITIANLFNLNVAIVNDSDFHDIIKYVIINDDRFNDVDLAMNYFINKEGVFNFSLISRKNSNINISDIVKKLGGSGEENKGSFTMSFFDASMMLKNTVYVS